MRKFITVLVATGVSVFAVSSLAGAANTATPSPQTSNALVAVLGKKVSVAPDKFAKAYAMCPKGYSVTGGGSYSGAITQIISSPMPNLQGWFVEGTNATNTRRTFQFSADAVCMKGSPASTASTAAAGAQLSRQAVAEYVASHGAFGGR
jgi:hypothetical protein